MTTTTAPASPEALEAPPPSSSMGSRIAKVFFSPGELFEEFRHHAPWGGVFLLIVGIAVVVQIAVLFIVPVEDVVAYVQNKAIEAGQQAPPTDQLQQGISTTRMLGPVIGLVQVSLIVFFSAAVCSLLYTVILGGEAGYGQYLAIVVHALMIDVAGDLLLLPMQLYTHQYEMQLSAALLVPDMSPTSLTHAFLSTLDIFSIWTLAVVALGAVVVNRRKFSWPTAFGLLLGVYLLFTLVPKIVIGKIFGPPAQG